MRGPCLILLMVACVPLPALAHAILLDSQPAAGSSVAAGPVHLVLRFNSRIDRARSRLDVRGPGVPVALRIGASAPDTIEADAVLPAGAVVLRWQVLAVDGHITRGDVPLNVRAP